MDKLNGLYKPINDGTGIIGFHFTCGKCGHVNKFSDNTYCEQCDSEHEYIDPDDWYFEQMKKMKYKRAWNI